MTDAELAARAGIPLRLMLAIRAVESAGRVRAVRFEPHRFHRETAGRFTTAQVPWTPGGRPGKESVSYTPSETNRAAFERAFRYDPRVAVESSSWGAYQVLGGHLLRVAGSDPARAIAAFDASPETVGREMFVSWMQRNADARRYANAGDIERLAEEYNGSQDWARAVRRALARIPEGASTSAGIGFGTLVFAALAGYAVWRWKKR